MKAEFCIGTGSVFLICQTKKEERESIEFFGKYKTFTGEFRMELTTLWDKYADGDEETALCFTVEPEDSEEKKEEK